MKAGMGTAVCDGEMGAAPDLPCEIDRGRPAGGRQRARVPDAKASAVWAAPASVTRLSVWLRWKAEGVEQENPAAKSQRQGRSWLS